MGEALILRSTGHYACRFGAIVLGAIGLSTHAAFSQVDLEWRVDSTTVRVGDTIAAGLYAVSHAPSEELLGVDAIIEWDQGLLSLSGHANDSPFPFKGFNDDELLDGLNADCGPTTYCVPYTEIPFNDGEALFTAGELFSVWEATPVGLLVTTLLFEAIGPSIESRINLVEQVGVFSFSRVVRRIEGGGEIVTGSLGSLSVWVAACGTMGDFNDDCGVSGADYVDFGPCLLGPDQTPVGNCGAADFDADGDSDLRDIGGMQQWFTGP